MEDKILDRDIALRHGTLDLFFAKGSIIHREGNNFYILPPKSKPKSEKADPQNDTD